MGDQLVQPPGRPRKQYELALHGRRRGNERELSILLRPGGGMAGHYHIIIGLARGRLGRYSNALATLRQNDVPKLSPCSLETLMSPWNPLTFLE